jgi:hypothetical protein
LDKPVIFDPGQIRIPDIQAPTRNRFHYICHISFIQAERYFFRRSDGSLANIRYIFAYHLYKPKIYRILRHIPREIISSQRPDSTIRIFSEVMAREEPDGSYDAVFRAEMQCNTPDSPDWTRSGVVSVCRMA